MIAVVFGVVLPRMAPYGEVADVLGRLTAAWIATIVVAEALNLGTYGIEWIFALPGMTHRRSMQVSSAGSAIASTLPLGAPVSMGVQWGMFRAWGFKIPEVSRALLLTGVLNNAVNLAMPAAGLAVLTARGGKNAALQTAAVIGVGFLVLLVALSWLVLRSDVGARRVGQVFDVVRARVARIRRRPVPTDGPELLDRFRVDSIDLLRDNWWKLLVSGIVGVLTVFGVLIAAVRAVGIMGAEVTLTEAFAAWSATRLLSTAFPVTPGGLGVVDVGLAAALIGFGGPHDQVVTAVLIYRLVTFIPPIVMGGIAILTTRGVRREAVTDGAVRSGGEWADG